uniref:TGB1 n=1 Tax=Garlic virus B TaxID=12432 RepID=A0A6M2YUC1_9VIRU|nr:TGB1 [Garlic virus B]
MFPNGFEMKISLLIQLLTNSGFQRTTVPLEEPIVIHGVPGCGKSTLIRTLITHQSVIAYTLGIPYGKTLAHPGIQQPTNICDNQEAETRILDEYQLGSKVNLEPFNVLVGDPFQGHSTYCAHFVKTLSHRVPHPVCEFLNSLGYSIQGDKEGSLKVLPVFQHNSEGPKGVVIHLGPISCQLTQTYRVPSKTPAEVQGLEFKEVTLVFHSSELPRNTEAFFIATTRASECLNLITDQVPSRLSV